METVIYSTHKFEKDRLLNANINQHNIRFLEVPLNCDTAYLAKGALAVSIFVNDDASAPVLEKLSNAGVKFLVLRSAGYNHVNLEKAKELGIRIARVPAYSPYAVAEHAVALMLALNRKLIRANNRVHELNFSLDGLTGFDMHGKTVGIIGTGQIGSVIARILYGFDCRILAVDKSENKMIRERFGVIYSDYETLYKESDIITLHIPLSSETRYIICKETISKMKQGVMLINTSRGALINTKDVIEGLKIRQIGYLGIDVYEEESGLFFEDHSEDILQDDTISRLLTFNNVLITSHQAFLTNTALHNIASVTIYNLNCFYGGGKCENEL